MEEEVSSKSAITWTDQTWSPVTGCTKVSDGCKHCYAEREVETRWSKNPKSIFFGRAFSDVRCHPEKLEEPLHWKKGRKIFVCPRGDLFHKDVSDEVIDKVFEVMARCQQHTFQVLTKRPERMRDYLGYLYTLERILPNVWLGVSVEDQATANERIPLLMETPAAVRWVSIEPMLGAVDLVEAMGMRGPGCRLNGWVELNWVVCGGESGRSARPMHPDWVRSLRSQCQYAGVPFLFKQWGEWCDINNTQITAQRNQWGMFRVGTKAAGRLLDGVLYDEYPQAGAT